MQKPQWSSRLAFILVSAGAAVGLGNIWRFPYITGENGGGAFVLVYLFFVIALGIPLLMSEVLIGRRGGANAAFSYRNLAVKKNRSKWWMLAGALPIVAGFLILSYYAVITGWVLDFLLHSVTDTFSNITPEAASQLFSNMLADPMRMLFWDTLVIAGIIFIIARGIEKGLEKTVYIMFPALLILMTILIIYAIKSGSFWQGVTFLFSPNFHALTAQSILLALGQAFFSLSIGTGIMLTYGKYVSKETSIAKTCVIIALMDTLVAVIAGLAIFPIVFANGLAPTAGPSLIFETLPLAFGAMPFGDLFAGLFFLMLIFAAITSAMAILEPTVVWMMEYFKWTRAKAAMTAGLIAWVLSLGTIASFNIASSYTIFGKTFFDALEYIASNYMLPLGGLLVAIFTGWILTKNDTVDELGLNASSLTYKSWRFCMRYVAPLFIILIFLSAIGIF